VGCGIDISPCKEFGERAIFPLRDSVRKSLYAVETSETAFTNKKWWKIPNWNHFLPHLVRPRSY
jgi:hypothetical protein